MIQLKIPGYSSSMSLDRLLFCLSFGISTSKAMTHSLRAIPWEMSFM